MKPTAYPIRAVALLLTACILTTACGQSIVLIHPPYAPKVRPGDGVKVTDTKGLIHSGRVLHSNSEVLVIRTPKQVVADSPVERARFATTVRWEDVTELRVAGILDAEGRLISNEEIRVNRRTNDRRNYAVNVGLLGSAVSFLLGAAVQGAVSPTGTNLTKVNHGTGRAAFWTTFLVGTAGSIYGGYLLGDRADRKRSIARIERHRREATRLDSLVTRVTEERRSSEAR